MDNKLPLILPPINRENQDESESFKSSDTSNSNSLSESSSSSSEKSSSSSNSNDKSSTESEEKDEVQIKSPPKSRFWTYINDRSCAIFHKEWGFRQILLRLVIPSEDIIEEENAEEELSKLKIENIEEDCQQFSKMWVWKGKIISTKTAINHSRIFELSIITLILLSSLLLCVDTPLNNPDSTFTKILTVADFIFTFLFLLEAVFKIIALGFIWNSYDGIQGYIMNWWNIIDFVVVVVSIVDFYFSMTSDGNDTQSLKSLKALRAIRALRPLRMISRNEGLKIAVKALFASIPAMGNVLMVCFLFLLIFSIMGIDFFKGQFYSWKSKYTSLLNQVKTRRDCLDTGGEWANPYANFDNIFNAILAMFETMTTDGWIEIMSNGIDANGIENQPKYK
jgi:hypothetical protein